jgi:CheY-like chemotaxis protein
MIDQHCHKTIAVIEDDTAIRDAIAEALEDEGYDVIAADHGQDAFDQLNRRSEAPCVILLDLMMPVMDGWKFRDQQKQHPTLGAVPVIILTADAKAQDKVNALGAQGHMGKPVDLDRLLETVHQYC